MMFSALHCYNSVNFDFIYLNHFANSLWHMMAAIFTALWRDLSCFWCDVSRQTQTKIWMSSLPVYATLDFPTASSFPSLTCLQWTAEGQLVFATKSAAYILVLFSRFSHRKFTKPFFRLRNTESRTILRLPSSILPGQKMRIYIRGLVGSWLWCSWMRTSLWNGRNTLRASRYTPRYFCCYPLLSLFIFIWKLDWGAVSLGSIDLILVAVAISPSALSKTSG